MICCLLHVDVPVRGDGLVYLFVFLSAFYCHNVTVGLIALIVSVLWRDNGVGATVTTVTCVTVVTVRRD